MGSRTSQGAGSGGDPMTDRIDEIEKRLEAATPGPWRCETRDECTCGVPESHGKVFAGDVEIIHAPNDRRHHRANIQLIAAAPEALRYLLDLAKKSAETIAALADALEGAERERDALARFVATTDSNAIRERDEARESLRADREASHVVIEGLRRELAELTRRIEWVLTEVTAHLRKEPPHV